MTRSTPSRFSPFEISFAILATLALMLLPQAAFAQHGGGGGHAGGGGHFGGGHGGGGHFGGGHGGGHALAGFGTPGYSNAGSHTSPIHVFSGPRSSAPAASARAAQNSDAVNGAGRGAGLEFGAADVSSSGAPRGLGMFAEPGGSGETNLGARRAMPMHTTIGFPPSTDPRFMSISSARGREPLSFSGQGSQMWRNSTGVAANRNSGRVAQARPAQSVSPTPPHLPRRPFLGGAPFFNGSSGFGFFNPGFGFFGNDFGPGFGCDPFFAPSFGCSGFSPFGFGGGLGYLGFGGGYGGYAGDFGDAGSGYGYDGGYYAPPSFDVAPPNVDEGESQETAPGPYLNPPAENSSPDDSGAVNSAPAPAPETVIWLKDGTSFAVKDYWIADGQLHYVTSYGGENAVDLGDFDLQRTTDENAQQGISITLRPAPESQPPAQPQPASPQPPTQ